VPIPESLGKIITGCVTDMLNSVAELADAKLTKSGDGSGDTTAVGVASVLGFTGEQVKGSLVVSCERALLAASHPNLAMGMPVDEGSILDWSGEIANQMLGRVKNKLSAIGIKMSMGTPMTVTGKAMQVRAAKDGHAAEFGFTTSKGALCVHFLVVISEGVRFDAEATATAASEGDSLLF
jgi:CheY-specific phosphatase CheX